MTHTGEDVMRSEEEGVKRTYLETKSCFDLFRYSADDRLA